MAVNFIEVISLQKNAIEYILRIQMMMGIYLQTENVIVIMCIRI